MFRHHLTLQNATEIALLVAALGFVGALSTRPIQRLWQASDALPCVHLGRAGAICEKPDAGQICENLGRAGRFCPPSGRSQ